MSPTWLSWKTENSRWSPCLERPQLWEMTFELGPKGRKGLVIPRLGKDNVRRMREQHVEALLLASLRGSPWRAGGETARVRES